MWCKYVSQFGLSSTLFCGGLPILQTKSRHSTLYCGGPHECKRPLRALVLRIEGTERSILHLVRLKQRGSSDYSGCSDLKTRDTAGAMPGCLSTIAHAQSPNCSTTSTTSRPTGSFASRFVFSSALSLHQIAQHYVSIRLHSSSCTKSCSFLQYNNRPMRWF